jgi:hypothetical protein
MTDFTRRRLMVTAAGVGLASQLSAPAIAQTFPARPITLVVPWGAGGGTDATARIVGSLMEKELGQPVNVVNRTGGSGVVGHSAIATAAADGYTIGMVTVEISMMHWQGLTQLKPDSYTPLALMNEDPPGVQVSASGPYKDLKSLADAIKANPGKLKASGTGQGGIWHLALVGWLRRHGPARQCRAVGAVQRCGPGHAGPRRRWCRHRHLLGSRGQGHARRGPRQVARHHGGSAQSAVRRCADAEGGDRASTTRSAPGVASPPRRTCRRRSPSGTPRCSRRSTNRKSSATSCRPAASA